MTGLALAAFIGQASAQAPNGFGQEPRLGATRGAIAPVSQLQLTTEQKTAIGNAVRASDRKVSTADNVPAMVGASVPPVTELYFLPDNALANAPEAKGLKYTVARNRVVLVDPTTMRVVDVIP